VSHNNVVAYKNEGSWALGTITLVQHYIPLGTTSTSRATQTSTKPCLARKTSRVAKTVEIERDSGRSVTSAEGFMIRAREETVRL
jgi:hypothetical protein